MLPITNEGLTEGDERDSLTITGRNPNSQRSLSFQELAALADQDFVELH
jgi:hypothetical protein